MGNGPHTRKIQADQPIFVSPARRSKEHYPPVKRVAAIDNPLENCGHPTAPKYIQTPRMNVPLLNCVAQILWDDQCTCFEYASYTML